VPILKTNVQRTQATTKKANFLPSTRKKVEKDVKKKFITKAKIELEGEAIDLLMLTKLRRPQCLSGLL
jgi:hypothetical protein